jgi:hypothetical protein
VQNTRKIFFRRRGDAPGLGRLVGPGGDGARVAGAGAECDADGSELFRPPLGQRALLATLAERLADRILADDPGARAGVVHLRSTGRKPCGAPYYVQEKAFVAR